MTRESTGQQPVARTAHKVLNNNVVIAVDASGRERVLMGRGLGFGLKPDDAIDLDKVEKTFILDTGAAGVREQQLLTDVPYSVIQAVSDAIDAAERSLGRRLGRHLTIALVDHIQFVLERLDKGVRIPTTTLPELRVLYPQEFAVAEQMAASIAASLDRTLPPEEAVFVTMHLLNATRDEFNGTAALLLRRLQHIVDLVQARLAVRLDTSSPDYARFVVHVQFLLQRLVNRSMLTGGDTSFFEFAKHSYPISYAVAEQVKAYVREATEADLTDEELLYVIVHVERLRSQIGLPAQQPSGAEPA